MTSNTARKAATSRTRKSSAKADTAPAVVSLDKREATPVFTDTVLATLSVPTVTRADALREWSEEEFTRFTADTRHAVESLTSGLGGLMFGSAVALYRAKAQDMIGKDAKFPTQGDYATALGYSKGYASKLGIYGRAIAVHGIEDKSQDWGTLVSNYSGPLATIIRGEDSNAVREALSNLRKYGSLTPPAVEEKTEEEGGDTRSPGGLTDQTEDENGRPVVKTAEDVIHAVHAMIPTVRELSEEGQQKVEEYLLSVVADLRARREAFANTVSGEVVGE